MKVFIALFALIVAVFAEPSYVPAVVPAPVSTSVWPPYGVYGKALLRHQAPAIVNYGYPAAAAGVYGSWPVASYGNSWGYSAPVVAAYGSTKYVDNGLWNYGGHGYGLGYNKYWL